MILSTTPLVERAQRTRRFAQRRVLITLGIPYRRPHECRAYFGVLDRSRAALTRFQRSAVY